MDNHSHSGLRDLAKRTTWRYASCLQYRLETISAHR
jgi:hypothetical protein